MTIVKKNNGLSVKKLAYLDSTSEEEVHKKNIEYNRGWVMSPFGRISFPISSSSFHAYYSKMALRSRFQNEQEGGEARNKTSFIGYQETFLKWRSQRPLK